MSAVISLLKSDMGALAEQIDAYRKLFDGTPNDRLSVAAFESGQEGPSIAYAVLIDKPLSLSTAVILSLMWSRLFVFVEEWDSDGSRSLDEVWQYALSGNYMSEEFARFVALGAFSPIDPLIAQVSVERLVQLVRFDSAPHLSNPIKSYSERCSGKVSFCQELRDRLTSEEFLLAHCITNNWNDESYFFETPKGFGYFCWGTSA